MNGHQIAKLSSYSAARSRPATGRFATEEMGMAVNSLQKQPVRGQGRPFEKGRSGNPAGRPRGARNKATLAAEALFDSEAEALSRKAVELALGVSVGGQLRDLCSNRGYLRLTSRAAARDRKHERMTKDGDSASDERHSSEIHLKSRLKNRR
jgi:hypothetical protein